MHELSKKDIEALTPGEVIFRIAHTKTPCRTFRVVGRIPNSDRYLVLSEGEHLETVFIPTYNGGIYGGTYDAEFVGRKIIEFLNKDIRDFSEFYMKEKPTTQDTITKEDIERLAGTSLFAYNEIYKAVSLIDASGKYISKDRFFEIVGLCSRINISPVDLLKIVSL